MKSNRKNGKDARRGNVDKVVLDASAALALFKHEAGGEVVRGYIPG